MTVDEDFENVRPDTSNLSVAQGPPEWTTAFTGRIQIAPREVDSMEMKKIVAETPGAIGYIPIQEVDTSVRAVLLIFCVAQALFSAQRHSR